MSNEIKQGDKVRVREDAPRMYVADVHNLFKYHVSKLLAIEEDNAIIRFADIGVDASIVLPLKYLVKVEEEKKEPKYHKGDRVKFKNIYELQKVKDKSFRWMLVMFASKEATITAVEDNGFYRVDIDPSIGGINDDMIECKVEPTEQTEAEYTKTKGDTLTFPIVFDLSDSYWGAYAAELAKEVVLKVANKKMDNHPEEIGAYAVSVAKAVVEWLKRK